MKNKIYSKEYYTTNNYSDYLSRYDRYKNLSIDIEKIFKELNLNNKDLKILDYGCAVGFLLDALKEKDYQNLSGFDISDFCVSIFSKNHNLIDIEEKQNFEIMIILDVLEHMEDSEIEKVFKNINSKYLLVRIPCAKEGEDNFYLDISKRDETHINCKTKSKWINFLKNNSYEFKQFIELENIYDSEGVFCGVFINEEI